VSDRRWTIDPQDAGSRLDKFLAASDRLTSRGRAVAALERGKVFVNEHEVTPADAAYRLVAGDLVRIWIDRPGSARKRTSRASRRGELNIVYEDDTFIVINKPPGILAVPLERQEDAPSVQDFVELHLRSRGKRKPLVVPRIDRDTSGLIVFATRPDAWGALRGQFRRREPERVYLAVVYGIPSPPSGTWRDHLVWDQKALIQKETHARDPRGKLAECRYAVVRGFRETALIEVRLVTGLRNQIRLQARLRGHTLVGEQRYIYGEQGLRPIDFDRQALHAYRLAFRHPLTREPLSFEAPVPSDMASLIDALSRD
jgi:23S rRNA pseudouridine1911/1915/1917 synthase